MEHLITDGLYTITGPHEVDDLPGFGIGCVVRYGNDFNDANQYKMWDILKNDFWWVDADAITPYENPFQAGDVVRLAGWVSYLDNSICLNRYHGLLITIKNIEDKYIVSDNGTLLAPLFQMVERPVDTETSLPKEINAALNGTISRNQFLSWMFTQNKLVDNVPPFELHRLMDDTISLEEFTRHASIAWEHIRREKGAIQHRIDLARDEITTLQVRIASLEKEMAEYD